MTSLLAEAVEAHGGLDRWREITTIEAAVSITGAIWHLKGRPDVLKDVAVVVRTDTERVEMTFVGKDRRTVFTPDRVSVLTADGSPMETRDDPESSFTGHRADTPWDDVHVAYFSGEALWTYLSVPFLYTRPDFAVEEIAPIEVDGEKWRRLAVDFPDSVRSHTRRQISCFGPDGLLRRHDYTVDVLGGGTGLNYASEYREVDGIVVPTRRRIVAYEGDYLPVPEPLLVAIDFDDITVHGDRVAP